MKLRRAGHCRPSGMSLLVDSFLDLLAPLGDVTARRLFGGHGFYKDGIVFAVEAYGRLFVKVDEENKARFVEAGCLPFTIENKDRRAVLSYFEPPESAFINPQKMKPWAALGFEAAQRSASGKSQKSKPKNQGRSKSQASKSKR
jgi:DNA transformation protein and related proteins